MTSTSANPLESTTQYRTAFLLHYHTTVKSAVLTESQDISGRKWSTKLLISICSNPVSN